MARKKNLDLITCNSTRTGLSLNGAGKTTTINMLIGLSMPDSGTIRTLMLQSIAESDISLSYI